MVSHSLSSSSAAGSRIPNPRLIAKPIVEIVGKLNRSGGESPVVQLEIVRPGTWKALRKQLESRGKGWYHLVHFDVHGKVTWNEKARKEQ